MGAPEEQVSLAGDAETINIVIPENPILLKDIPDRHRLRLGGITVGAATIIETGDSSVATVKVSSIITALQQDYISAAFWKGMYRACQPKSYGMKQLAPVEPIIDVELR